MADREYSEAVRRLIDYPGDTVPASVIAPVVKMHPSVIIDYAKRGKWELSACLVSGDRVKFFKQDFLEKTGLKEREPEEPTDHQLMLAVVDALTAILETQKSILMQLDQQNDMIHAIAPGFALRCMENKTAASGN